MQQLSIPAGLLAIRHTPMTRCRSTGFSLIELMIVVAIAAILAAIALPSYRASILKSHRTDAKMALTKAAQLMERRLSETGSYLKAASGTTYPTLSENGYYLLGDPTSLSLNTFTITAVPQGGQAADSCGSFSIDEQGKHLPDTDGCW